MKCQLSIVLILSFHLSFGQKGVKQSLSLWERTNSTISVLYNANYAHYNYTEKIGFISTKNRFSGYGFGFSKNFYGKNHTDFLTIGIKYFNVQSYLRVATDVYGIESNYTSVHYSLKYDRIVIPIYFGKRIKLFNKKLMYAEPFVGASLGLGYMTKLSADFYLQKSNNDNDTVGLTGPSNTMDLGPFRFYSSLDLGFRITPFNNPNFTLGALATMDLTQSNKYGDEGNFINYSKGIQQDYKFNFDVKHINLMFSINYTFGKR
jgi:hypothetical protein